MKEARIQCLCADYRLPDLMVGGAPLALRQGQVAWVSESAAQQSKSLAHAERVGAVSVEWHERYRVAKSPTPPWLKRKQARPSRPARAPDTPKVQDTPAPVVDMEEVTRRAEVAAAKAATTAVNKGVAEIKALLDAQAPGIPQDQLEAALRKVLPTTQHAAPASCVSGVTEEPVFIPKDLVSKGSDDNISIATEASQGGSLDAAAEALKAAKPPRKRAPRKRKPKPKTPTTEK